MSTNKKTHGINPPIPYDRPAKKAIKKEDLITFKLKSDPNNADSPLHTLSIQPYSLGTCEELLNFIIKINKIIKGQNITTGPNQFALIRQLLQGDALSAFNAAATSLNETVDNFKSCINLLIKHVFPHRALAIQKQYMNRVMRKPLEVTIRQYRARVEEIRTYLKSFPGYTIAHEMSDDDIKDLLEHGIPNAWKKEMTRQGFDPIENTTTQFVEFCERMEVTESINSTKFGTRSNASPSDGKHQGAISHAKSSERGTKSKRKKRQNEKFCVYHNCYGHDTGECKVVLDQAKKMRAQYEASPCKYSWNRNTSKKPEGKNQYDKKELHTLIASTVEKVMKKQNKQSYSVESVDELTKNGNYNDDSSSDSE